jgi:hypothetical protein
MAEFVLTYHALASGGYADDIPVRSVTPDAVSLRWVQLCFHRLIVGCVAFSDLLRWPDGLP